MELTAITDLATTDLGSMGHFVRVLSDDAIENDGGSVIFAFMCVGLFSL